MEFPAKPRYRVSKGLSKADREQNYASREALDPIVKPALVKHDASRDVKKSPGPKKKVVRDFLDNDERADKMGKYIQEGLSAQEAGLLAGYSPEELRELQSKSIVYRRFVEQQLIKFKQTHLKVITSRPDAKTSQWLLERTFPHEFSTKRPVGDGGSGDRMVIAAIFKTIQEQSDSPIPVKITEDPIIHDAVINQKETADHRSSPEPQQHQPTLEPGGANII